MKENGICPMYTSSGSFFRSFLPHNWDKTADNSDTLFTTILICFLTSFQNGPDLCPDNNSPSLFFPFMRDPCGLEPSLTLIKNVLQDAVSKILRLAFVINECPLLPIRIIHLSSPMVQRKPKVIDR